MSGFELVIRRILPSWVLWHQRYGYIFGCLRVRILISILSVLFGMYVGLSGHFSELLGWCLLQGTPETFQILSLMRTTVSSECMDIRDGGERTSSRSGYCSSAECLVWTSLERENFLPFWEMNLDNLLAVLPRPQRRSKTLREAYNLLVGVNSQIWSMNSVTRREHAVHCSWLQSVLYTVVDCRTCCTL